MSGSPEFTRTNASPDDRLVISARSNTEHSAYADDVRYGGSRNIARRRGGLCHGHIALDRPQPLNSVLHPPLERPLGAAVQAARLHSRRHHYAAGIARPVSEALGDKRHYCSSCRPTVGLFDHWITSCEPSRRMTGSLSGYAAPLRAGGSCPPCQRARRATGVAAPVPERAADLTTQLAALTGASGSRTAGSD